MTITTGSQVVNATFTVIAGVPQITLISPNTIQPTQTESVSVTGAFTNWASGTTKANFGPGISVGGAPAGAFGPVTVTSATSLTAKSGHLRRAERLQHGADPDGIANSDRE